MKSYLKWEDSCSNPHPKNPQFWRNNQSKAELEEVVLEKKRTTQAWPGGALHQHAITRWSSVEGMFRLLPFYYVCVFVCLVLKHLQQHGLGGLRFDSQCKSQSYPPLESGAVRSGPRAHAGTKHCIRSGQHKQNVPPTVLHNM